MEWWWWCLLLIGFGFVCGCPCACIQTSDNFNRADNTDINTGSPCGWTEVAGTSDIESNTLKFTGTGALITSSTASSTGAVRVDITPTSATAGDKLRIILDYVDTNNYHFAELVFADGAGAGGSLTIYKRSVGVNTSIVSTTSDVRAVSAGTNLHFLACINYGLTWIGALAYVDPNRFEYAVAGSATTLHGGTTCGLGTGGTVSSNIKVDNYFQSDIGTTTLCAACTVGGCTNCIDDDVQSQWKVVIAGIANQVCLLCAAANGTHYLEYISSCTFQSGSGITGCTALSRLKLEVKANNVIKVWFTEATPATDTIVWEDAATSGDVDCDETVDRSVPFSADNTTQCAGAAATCIVTSQ